MADEQQAPIEEPQKCPPCPEGLPAWMATFSDLVTLLLTFFVLLLSFAKTETAKFEAALGSVRNAFGGNVLKQGEVILPGKSPDNTPTMMESQEPLRPFPIEFLTTEGFLDKHEINRESTEDLAKMRSSLKEYQLAEDVNVYEQPEGIQVSFQEKIYFAEGSIQVVDINVKVIEKIVSLLKDQKYILYILSHAANGETGPEYSNPLDLSISRAKEVMNVFLKKGVPVEKLSPSFLADSQPPITESDLDGEELRKEARRVEFILRKVHIRDHGRKVRSL
jgi:chemotaxis protein MotB